MDGIYSRSATANEKISKPEDTGIKLLEMEIEGKESHHPPSNEESQGPVGQ